MTLELVIDNDAPKNNAKGYKIVSQPKLYQRSKDSGISDGPTIERIKKTFAVDKDGGLEVVLTEDGARQFQDELLVRMASKGQLYPDTKINEALLLAGTKYHEDWYGAGMSGLQAIDYGKVSGGQGGSGSSMPASRIAAQHRANYREARKALPAKYRRPVEAILLEGKSDLVAIGKAISGAASPHTARSVAIERFTTGLYLLALHYKMVV